ncbi:MAG: hypothetical protein NTV05_17340 [Acidobacteria bacterium]|nr:hypothetical protein [Acidobacteriota bacterium]
MNREPRSSIRLRPGLVAPLVCLTLCTALGFVAPAPAGAQMVMNTVDHLSFDRPESWALKYFTSATLPGGIETPRALKPGSVLVGLEAGWLPPLSDAQRTVGYNGTQTQDLNKAPFFPRPRVTIGLPGSLAIVIAAVPPIPMFGLTTKLLALAVERPVFGTSAVAVGLRVYGQIGTVRGAYTCPVRTAALAPGSAGNPEGCQAASSDAAALRYAGGEATVAFWPDASNRLSPHLGVGLSYMNVGFQVDALTFGMIDHTHYLSHGTAVSASGGVSYRLTNRLTLGLDAFYSPLSVRRGFAAPVQNDGFFNLRTLVTYRLR